MEKEQVTLYQIKKDLLQYLWREVSGIIIGFPLLWLTIAIGNSLLKKLFSINDKLFRILTLILILCEILCFIYVCVLYIKIKKLKFILKKDYLIEKRDYRPGGTVWHSYRPYRLSFTSGYFDIPAQTNYKWSSIYSMNEKQIYDTSSIDDTFTFIVFNKKVIAVYNHKFF